MRALVWTLAIAALLGTCVALEEFGWTGVAWLVAAFLVDRHFANQARIAAELAEMNRRANQRDPYLNHPPPY